MVEYLASEMRVYLFYYSFQHGRLPKDLNELVPYEQKSRLAEYAELKKFVAYQPDGTNWQARVAPSGRFAGHYLVNQSRALYFHRWRPATTNDLRLKPPAN